MSQAWRQTPGEASDSDDDVVFMGPVTDRELEISRLLNETICLPDADASDSTNDTLAGLEGGLRAVYLEGTRESCTMNELELPTAATGAGGYPVTSSRLEESVPPLASSENTSSRHWEELPSEQPLSSTRLTEPEASQHWEEMPSECPLSVPPSAEESRVWEELPSECPLSVPPQIEESRVWEEMPSECPLSVPPPAEESRVWEEMPSECPLSVPPPAEESRVWEELPSECPLSVPPLVEESVCEELSDEKEPVTDGSHWLTLASDDLDAGPGDSLDERRETAGALLGALCDELAEAASVSSGSAAPSVVLVPAGSPRAVQPVSPRTSSSGGGLLQAMHRQLSSPSAVSVAASVESYHTCYGGGAAADDSRRLTAASALSDISMAPAAPPNSTLGAQTVDDSEDSEDDSRLYESSVEEQPEQQHSVTEIPQASAAAAADDTRSDNISRSPPLAGRDRMASLASESSLAGSYMSGTSTGSELNDTLEMMEKLLAMEAEERRLESILQSRTTAGETVLQDDQHAASGAMDSHVRPAGGDTAKTAAHPAAGTPGRPTPAALIGKKTTPTAATTPRGRGRPAAAPTPRQQLAAKSPARLVTPRGKMVPSPAQLATPRGKMVPSPARSATTTTSRLRTPTPASKTATVAPQPTTPRTKPNLKDIVSPVARYIHDGPEPTLVQNLRPKSRVLNNVVPQPRPTPQKLSPLAEEAAPPAAPENVTGKVLQDLNISTASTASNTSGVSAGSSASAGSRIPVKVSSRPAGGQENRWPPSSLPKVSYKSSGNLVMDKVSWNKLVRKNTAENRKVGRFLPSPSPVLAVKHTGHKSVSSRRVRWNDEFAVPDMAVRVRPMRRSVSDCDITQSSEASLMEVSVCEVRSARPTVVRH